MNIDIQLLRYIQDNRLEQLDQILYFISLFTTYINLGLIFSILIISLYRKSKPLRFAFYKLAVVFIAAALISFAIKNMINRDRPFVTYPDIEKLSEAGSFSFPSGHTMEVFALAVAFSIAFPGKKFIIPIFTWALLVAYSRIALGVHYPFDVAGGMIIGSFIGWVVPKIFSMEARKRGSREVRKRG